MCAVVLTFRSGRASSPFWVLAAQIAVVAVLSFGMESVQLAVGLQYNNLGTGSCFFQMRLSLQEHRKTVHDIGGLRALDGVLNGRIVSL